MKSVLGNRMLLWSLVIPLLSVLLALATAGILLYSSGANPIDAYSSMVSAALGSPFALSTTVIKALPRLLPAVGIAVALRAGLWNIGAEGQLYIGALAATGTALFGPHLGFPGSAALALVAAMLGGAAWAAIAGALRAVRGISEVITSLMLVYVAIQLTNYLVEGAWLVPNSTFPATSPVPIDARLPNILPGTMLNAGVFVAVVVVAASWFVIARTSFGLKIRAIGGNPRAARVAGLRVNLLMVLVMAVSGALAGLAGGVEVLGVRGRLIEGFSAGYGFEAIAIALLGRLNPVGIAGAALLFGALDAGGAGLQTAAKSAPAAIVPIVEALAVLYLLIGLGIVDRLSRRRQSVLALEAAASTDLTEPASKHSEGHEAVSGR